MKRLSTLVLGTLLAAAAAAHDYKLGPLEIGHPWARPTVQGQANGGGYLKIRNKSGTADRLVGAASSTAERVELHSMSMEGDIMRMRQVDAIEVAAGASVELKPGGLHVMLLGLKAPLKIGTRVPLTLQFEKAGKVEVELSVDDAAPDVGGGHKHP